MHLHYCYSIVSIIQVVQCHVSIYRAEENYYEVLLFPSVASKFMCAIYRSVGLKSWIHVASTNTYKACEWSWFRAPTELCWDLKIHWNRLKPISSKQLKDCMLLSLISAAVVSLHILWADVSLYWHCTVICIPCAQWYTGYTAHMLIVLCTCHNQPILRRMCTHYIDDPLL